MKETPFKPGDAVLMLDENVPGIVVEPEKKDPLPTPHHVAVRVGKNHPMAYLKHPIIYSVDKLRKVERKGKK